MASSEPRLAQDAAGPITVGLHEVLPRPGSGTVRRGKLRRPEFPASAISRLRILRQIDQAGHPLVLIVAPAGFGKTLAAAEWAALDPAAVWLTADAADASLPRFWDHLRAALAGVTPGFGELVGFSLTIPHRAPAIDLGRLLADELLDAPLPVRLVIDDLHTVPPGEVYEFLTGLLEAPPPALRLLITARSEPPLPLARLRIRDALTELRGSDLLFSEKEAASYVVAMTDDREAPFGDHVRELWRRTGGWPAGLRLATTSGQGKTASNGGAVPERSFDSTLLAPLLEETLAERSAVERAVLLRAAIPERFNHHVVAALTDAGSPDTVAEMIRFAQAADLCRPSPMLGGTWFEFHPLFRAALGYQLEVDETPASREHLHRTAAAWFAAAGMLEDAISHWLEAGEQETAAELVERETHRALAREDWPTIARWLARLPDEMIAARPQLMLARAWLAHFRGRYGMKRDIMQALDRRLEESDLPPETISALQAEVDVLRLDNVGTMQREPGTAAAIARRALQHLKPDRRFPIGTASQFLGMALYCSGQSSDGEAILRRCLEQDSQHMDAGAIRGLLGLCLVQLQAGELTNAVAHARSMSDLATTHRLRLAAGWGLLIAGGVLFEMNESEESIGCCAAIARDYEYSHFVCILEALFTLAQAYLAGGRAVEAKRAMRRAHEILVAADAVEQLPLLHTYNAYLDLLMGDDLAAMRWAQENRPAAEQSSLYPFLSPATIRATILCAAGGEDSLDEVDHTLAVLRSRAARTHFVTPLVRIDALQAIADLKRGKQQAAHAAMRRSLAIGVPRGFVRAYLDLVSLFPAAMHHLLAGATVPAAIRSALARHSADDHAGGKPDALVEPVAGLTPRELEILTALDGRLTYEAIADRLFISPHTVKRHACNIYGKLGVSGRVAALQAARAMGWQPGAAPSAELSPIAP